MLKVEVLFEIFSKIFCIFGFWPKGSPSIIQSGSFFLCIVIFPILVCVEFLSANSVEEAVIALFYFGGYTYVFSAIFVIWYKRKTVESLMSKISTYFHEDDLALPFISNAVKKSNLMATFMMTWTTFVLSFGIIIVPAFLNILPIPMWKPNFMDKDVEFGFLWLYQIYSVLYTLSNVCIFTFMCVLLLLINGYAEYLSSKLGMLVSTTDYSGYLELVDCIQVHQKLKE